MAGRLGRLRQQLAAFQRMTVKVDAETVAGVQASMAARERELQASPLSRNAHNNDFLGGGLRAWSIHPPGVLAPCAPKACVAMRSTTWS